MVLKQELTAEDHANNVRPVSMVFKMVLKQQSIVVDQPVLHAKNSFLKLSIDTTPHYEKFLCFFDRGIFFLYSYDI
jgi:hypothetical protein